MTSKLVRLDERSIHVERSRSTSIDSGSLTSTKPLGDSAQEFTTRGRRTVLYEEFRLIERGEAQINAAWRGTHILLFFLAFIFGTFCTFCFHMLMFMFDDKCVLFPKLLAVTAPRHNQIYDFMPIKDKNSTIQLEFVNAQWMDPTVCYLPAYVPLISAIFGLVWITMFIMCSAGTRTHTGLRSPWRVLIPVFIFSLVMSILCVHASSVTQAGLQAFCDTLAQITDGHPCSYAVNVISLAYHQRIRGVYQATKLTTISAWFHTICWLCSVALVVVRVCLAVDFQLVRVRVELISNVDLMLQRHEKHIRTISPDSETPKTNAETQDSGLTDEQTDKKSRKAQPLISELTPSEEGHTQHSKITIVLKDKHAVSGTTPREGGETEAKATADTMSSQKPLKSSNVTELTTTVDADKDPANETILEYIRRLFELPAEDHIKRQYDDKTRRQKSEPKTKLTVRVDEDIANKPHISKAESNASKPNISNAEDHATKLHLEDEDNLTKPRTVADHSPEPEKQKNEAAIIAHSSYKKVNIHKYVLAHHPSQNITQQKELVNHDEEANYSKAPRHSEESTSRLRPSRSETNISLPREITRHLPLQSIKNSDETIWLKEPPSRPQSLQSENVELIWDDESENGEVISYKSPATGLEKNNVANRSKEPPTKPQPDEIAEDQDKQSASASKKEHPDSQKENDEPSTSHDASES